MILGMIENWTEEGFKHLKDLNLHAIEFCYNTGNDPKDLVNSLHDIHTWSVRYEVKVKSIGRWGTSKINPDGTIIEEELQNSYTMIDVCAALDCPVFNTGVNYIEDKTFEENCEYAIAYLKKVVDYGKEKNVKVAVYNCDWNNFVVGPKQWEVILPAVDGLGIKFDPSHCINQGRLDYLGEIKDWGDKIYHFHIKGTININGDHVDDPPAGLDMVNWREVMGLLYAKGYDGMLSIEPHSRIWRTGDLGEWGIKYTIDYISPMMYTK